MDRWMNGWMVGLMDTREREEVGEKGREGG